MVIHEPEIKKQDDEIIILSYIEVEGKRKDRSGSIQFRIPEEYESFIAKSSNSFIVGSIFLAMELEEDITVKGHMSPKLSYGLKIFQEYFNYWYPERFKLINIKCDNYKIETTAKKGIGSAFSGGVDSFYTLYSHLSGRIDSKDAVTHCLFLKGMDKRIGHDENHIILREHYRKLISKMGLNFLSMATNVRYFLDDNTDINALISFGVVLISAVLILPIYKRFYISSGHEYDDLIPYGSNPITDHNLSIENLDFVYYGADKSRLKKTYAISEWPETYDNLRVCSPWPGKDGLNNCCRCDKCTRTMLTLYLKGALEKYKKSFKEPLDIRNWRFATDYHFYFAKEILKEAIRLGREDVAEDIKYIIKESGFDLNLNKDIITIAKNFIKYYTALDNHS